jgi:acetyl-CoA acyltransferase 2
MAFIVAANRTAFGTFGGALKQLSATDLAVASTKGALQALQKSQPSFSPSAVGAIVFGSVSQTSADAPYLPRHVALRSGLPVEAPALGINRLCGSGFEAVVQAARLVRDEVDVAICGGAESMSQAPLAVYGHEARWGVQLGQGLKVRAMPPAVSPRFVSAHRFSQLTDTLWSALTDSYAKMPMAHTAEKLGDKYGVTRAQCDEFALRSQQTWAAASKAGHFAAEISGVTVKGKKGEEVFAVDEHPRPATTLEGLAKLKPVFKENGLVTAGNASGICDGAATLIVASEAALSKHSLKPLARVVSSASVGVDPTIMGIGPAPAMRQALAKAKLTMADMDLIEINEAFAAQFLACEKELGLDRAKCNTSGGAIALGHPLGASGARITAHLVHALHRTGGKYAIGAACIGGGQGIALVLERV